MAWAALRSRVLPGRAAHRYPDLHRGMPGMREGALPRAIKEPRRRGAGGVEASGWAGRGLRGNGPPREERSTLREVPRGFQDEGGAMPVKWHSIRLPSGSRRTGALEQIQKNARRGLLPAGRCHSVSSFEHLAPSDLGPERDCALAFPGLQPFRDRAGQSRSAGSSPPLA